MGWSGLRLGVVAIALGACSRPPAPAPAACHDGMSDAALEAARGIRPEVAARIRLARTLSNRELCELPPKRLARLVEKTDPLAADHPSEAARLRRRQQQDERGVVPTGAVARAKAQADGLRLAPARKPAAGITRASWSALGPGNIGGRIRAIALHPAQPSRILVGGVAGGVWRSTDGGASFSLLDDFMGNLAVSSLVVDPANANRILAGTGEGFYNFDAIGGAGIFKSDDGGATWAQLPATNTADFQLVNRIAMSQTTAGFLHVATRTGLYRSVDLGASFQQVLMGEVLDVRIDPTNGLDAIASARGTALYTRDGGLTWTSSTGLPAPTGGIDGRVELAIAPSNPTIVYASVDLAGGELYRSSDGGRTFARVSTGVGYLGTQGWYANTLWVDPTSAQTLIVGGLDLYRSSDGGVTLTQISDWRFSPMSAHADHHAIAAHPGFDGTSNTTVYFGNDGGLYSANAYSVTSLSGWQSLNHGLGITQFYGGAASATGVIVAGAQDNGMLRYAGNSEGWTSWAGGDGGYSAADPSDATRFYGEYVYLRVERSADGAASAEEIAGSYFDAGTGSFAWKPAPFSIPDAQSQRALFIAPFALDPNLPTRLYAGGWSLWRTSDVRTANSQPPAAFGGPSWGSVKPPTTGNAEISAITVQAGNADVLWVGHTNGDVYRTTDGTSASPTWTQLDGATLPNRYVFRIAIDPTSPAIAYVALGGFSQPNVWRTMDAGATWTAASGTGATQLPAAPVRALAIHPLRPTWLYAGTEVGLFTSEDRGATWSVPHDGPANVSVEELFFSGTQLVAVTHGRGVWRSTPATCSPIGGACDDGNACTTNDLCGPGGACAGTPVATDDGNPCTVDACNTITGVVTNLPGHAGTVCRASTGGCDPAETCTGTSAACPADALAAAGAVCRAATGACDVAETCAGGTAACPADVLASAGTTCRPAAGGCDLAESCTGASGACPADGFVAAGTGCSDGNACTAGDACNASGQCAGTPPPTDDGNPCTVDACDPATGVVTHLPGNAGTVCRASAGVCDVAETCSGSATACPPDGFVATGTPCRASAGACDVAEACTGAAAACPPDGFTPAGTTCRAAGGVCDVAETCTGSSAGCPGDVFAGAGTVCRASAGPCDVAEACTGGGPACPADAFVVAGATCRAAAGPCDHAEVCSGGAATCPIDAFAPAGRLCRASTGACDAAESCSGSEAGCPADLPAADGTSCSDANGCTAPDVCTAGRCAGAPSDAVCGAHAICTDDRGTGACSCNAGFGDCDGDRATGCETDVTASTAHCGRCDNPCVIPHGTPACLQGSCRPAACDAGYRATASGCVDVDECAASDRGGCSPDATCTNTDGSRTCTCKDGFAGDGVSCAANDRCAGVATDDGDPCTEDRCDPATGAVGHTPVAVDDQDACTDDACTEGGVVHTPRCGELECQALSSCDAQTGECLYAPAPDGTSCAAGTCKDGGCVAATVAPPAPKKKGCAAAPGEASGGAGLVMLGMAWIWARRWRRRSGAGAGAGVVRIA